MSWVDDLDWMEVLVGVEEGREGSSSIHSPGQLRPWSQRTGGISGAS